MATDAPGVRTDLRRPPASALPVRQQVADPDVPELHRVAVELDLQRLTHVVVVIGRRNGVQRRAQEFPVVLDDDAVLQDRQRAALP